MKKYLYLCLMALVCTVGFTACGDDDDDITIEEIERNKATNQNAQIKDSGNFLTLTYTAKIKGIDISAVGTYTFDGLSDQSKCTKASMILNYPNEAIAKQAYNEEHAQDRASGIVTLNGRQVIHDETDFYKGLTKTEVRKSLDDIIVWVMTDGSSMARTPRSLK